MSVEQRTNIKFCVKLGLRYTAILACLGQESLSGISGLWMVGWVWRMMLNLEGLAASKLMSTSKRCENWCVPTAASPFAWWRTSLGLIRNWLEAFWLTTWEWGRCVPKWFRSEDQKTRRLHVCQDILQQLQTDATLLEKVITGDESWIFEYDPETKHQSCQ